MITSRAAEAVLAPANLFPQPPAGLLSVEFSGPFKITFRFVHFTSLKVISVTLKCITMVGDQIPVYGTGGILFIGLGKILSAD